eukprot:gene23646-9175_t
MRMPEKMLAFQQPLCSGRTAVAIRPNRLGLTTRNTGSRIYVDSRPSLDPMEAKSDAPFKFGTVYRVHNDKEVKDLIAEQKGHTVVVMCKSSHCKPCKAYMSTYYEMATDRFPDTAFCDIIGDQSPETRKTMMDWKVKATPTFFIYVDGELTSTLAGKEKDGLGDAVLATLKPEHRGRDWVAADDSDDDEDDE